MIHPTTSRASRVRGVRLFEMRHVVDPVRGNLTTGEQGCGLPFMPLRYFITYGIPSAQTRGEHAHRQCAQLMLCAHGECRVLVDDGLEREEFHLNHPTLGVLVPPMVWAAEYQHSADSALLVLASHLYDPEDYIRDYQEFLHMVREEDTIHEF